MEQLKHHALRQSLCIGLIMGLPIQAAKDISPSLPAPIGPHGYYYQTLAGGATANFYVTANTAVANNTYALAVSKNGQKFTALAPAKALVDNQENAANPLTGQKIALLGLVDDAPAVVLDGTKKVYFCYSTALAPALVSIVSSNDLNDSNGNLTASVLKLAGARYSSSYLFAAVQNQAGDTFGAAGSGIALLKSQSTTTGTKEKRITHTLNVLNNGNAFSFTGALAALQIGTAATITSNNVDLWWDSYLNCLYVAVSVQAADASSGARAVVVGKISNNQLLFSALTPDAAVSGANQIIGANNSATTDVSIQKVRTMHTSTQLDYLIVAGGNGTSSTTGNQVAALPLVRSADGANGTLAKYDSTPTVTNVNGFYRSRAYTTAATAPSDLLTNSATAAVVGAGNLPLAASSQISDLWAIDDTVFVSISDAYSGSSTPGIFSSQALFDSLGRIQAWTPWQRVGGNNNQIWGMGYIPTSGDFWFIPGTDAANLTSLQRTVWGQGNADGLLGGTTSSAQVGLVANVNYPLQSLTDFSVNTAGFSAMALQIATGLNSVSLIETGRVQSGYFKPNQGDFSTGAVQSTDGSLPALSSNTKLATLSGGALKQLGPITASVVASAGSDHWLMVGGAHGLAVLCDSSGAGWSGTISQLSDLPSNLSFKKVGDYRYITRLISDQNYLYILTNEKLDRIALSSTNFANDTLNPVTLAQPSVNSTGAPNSYFDVAIAGPLALLATAQGLWRTGNGNDISTAGDQTAVQWTKLELPTPIGPVYQLAPLARTTDPNGWSELGNLYVLSAYRGYLQARINRLTVDLSGAITDDTIQFLPDQYVAGELSYFIDFYNFKDAFSYLAGSMYIVNSRDNTTPLQLQKLPNGIHSGSRYFVYKSGIFTEPLELAGLLNNQINRLIINSASGALMASGSFGLRVGE